MAKKNILPKTRDIPIILLIFLIFLTDTLYASKIKSESLSRIGFVSIMPMGAAAADQSFSAAAMQTDSKEETAAADKAKMEEDGVPRADANDMTDASGSSEAAPAGGAVAAAGGGGGGEKWGKLKVRKYRDRLILGDADFGFTLALIKKHRKTHPDLSKHIMATELHPLENLARNYPHTLFKNMANLSELDMVYRGEVTQTPDAKSIPDFRKWWSDLYHRQLYLWDEYGRTRIAVDDSGMILTGIDATKLHELFPREWGKWWGRIGYDGFHFERIHFNFPMSWDSSTHLEKLLQGFFVSASQIQVPGDRIHLTIPFSLGGRLYGTDIFAVSKPHYRIFKKHWFKNRSYPDVRESNSTEEDMWERYPGYAHSTNIGVPGLETRTKHAVRRSIEYVFERIESDPSKPHPPETNPDDIKVDDDSSDYFCYEDRDWYMGEAINDLMDHYFGEAPNAVHPDTLDLGRGRMHAINIDGLEGNVFQHNLIQREREITAGAEVIPGLTIPINIGAGEGNHWAGLYIHRIPNTEGTINIFYFDPLGNAMPQRLQDSLKAIYGAGGRPINFYQNNHRYQEDGCNCGPWVIEFFRAFIPIVERLINGEEVESLFAAEFNIATRRQAHRQILNPPVAAVPAAIPLLATVLSSAAFSAPPK
jgi:hypothetical protein